MARGVPVRARGRNRSRPAPDAAVEIVQGELLDLPGLITAADGCDAIVHCAALSAPWGTAADFEDANVNGTANVIAAARQTSVRRLVHISSPAVIFAGVDQRLFGDDAPDPSRHSSRYARTKQVADELVRAVSGTIETVILRPKAIYGAGDRALVPRRRPQRVRHSPRRDSRRPT